MPETESARGAENMQDKAEKMSSREAAVLCARAASDFKALDLVLLDVSRFSSFSDYFIICSGKSSRQVQGIADNIENSLREKGLKPFGVEGRSEGHWILMDYSDVIIHIFYEPVRYFYDLESLWADAPRVDWEQGPGAGKSES